MSERPIPDIERSASPRRDGHVVLALLTLCLVLVSGLALVSRNAPSAAQYDSVALETLVITTEEGCASFVSFWTTDTGIDAPVDAIEGLTSCRLSVDGQWFVPNGPDDPRLSDRSVLTVDETARVETLRALLVVELRALESALPSTLMESLEVNYEEENLPVFGHTKRGRTDFGVKRARFQRIAQAFLLSPRHAILADYVGWLMERRSTAAGQFETACASDPDFRYLLRACLGMRNEFGVASIPIIWELTDPLLIEEYLADRARSGEPLPTPPAETIE